MRTLVKVVLISLGVLFALVGVGVVFAAVSSNDSTTVSAPVATPSSKVVKDEPALTKSQQSAKRAAQSYIYVSSFSREHLIHQLVEFNKFTEHDATVAVNSMKIDYSKQAAKTAKDYMDYSGFSREGLIHQMVQFDKYTQAQAEYGAKSVGL